MYFKKMQCNKYIEKLAYKIYIFTDNSTGGCMHIQTTHRNSQHYISLRIPQEQIEIRVHRTLGTRFIYTSGTQHKMARNVIMLSFLSATAFWTSSHSPFSFKVFTPFVLFAITTAALLHKCRSRDNQVLIEDFSD